MSCEFCIREEMDVKGLLVFQVVCGGHDCGHRRIYGLIDEDCRQVIAKASDFKVRQITKPRIQSGFRGITETSTIW